MLLNPTPPGRSPSLNSHCPKLKFGFAIFIALNNWSTNQYSLKLRWIVPSIYVYFHTIVVPHISLTAYKYNVVSSQHPGESRTIRDKTLSVMPITIVWMYEKYKFRNDKNSKNQRESQLSFFETKYGIVELEMLSYVMVKREYFKIADHQKLYTRWTDPKQVIKRNMTYNTYLIKRHKLREGWHSMDLFLQIETIPHAKKNTTEVQSNELLNASGKSSPDTPVELGNSDSDLNMYDHFR